jgi:hypothetical protein
MVLFKLDFKKAYDKVSLPFLFRVMDVLGIPPSFAQWIQLLFTGAQAAVHLNGSATATFPVVRGVRQGYPLAPYLFLLIGEALNIATKQAMIAGSIEGIRLPNDVGQQLIIQYADDTNYTI